MFGDGREERLAALDMELRLRRNPEVTKRREKFWQDVAAAKKEAERIGKDAVISRLIENNPAYIRDLLETEDERFGEGALASRYAHTFWDRPLAEPGAHVSE